MVIRKIVMSAAVLILVQAMPSGAEFYQYKDQSGELHFTDNLSNVPEDQRAGIDAFQEIPATAAERTKSGEPAKSSNSSKPAPDVSTWNGKLQNSAETLDRERAALETKYETLRSEIQEFGNSAPTSESHADKIAHQAKVEELNRKIRDYENQRKEFDQKVADFNSRILGSRENTRKTDPAP